VPVSLVYKSMSYDGSASDIGAIWGSPTVLFPGATQLARGGNPPPLLGAILVATVSAVTSIVLMMLGFSVLENANDIDRGLGQQVPHLVPRLLLLERGVDD
jgi:hypothetical protein